MSKSSQNKVSSEQGKVFVFVDYPIGHCWKCSCGQVQNEVAIVDGMLHAPLCVCGQWMVSGKFCWPDGCMTISDEKMVPENARKRYKKRAK